MRQPVSRPAVSARSTERLDLRRLRALLPIERLVKMRVGVGLLPLFVREAHKDLRLAMKACLNSLRRPSSLSAGCLFVSFRSSINAVSSVFRRYLIFFFLFFSAGGWWQSHRQPRNAVGLFSGHQTIARGGIHCQK